MNTIMTRRKALALGAVAGGVIADRAAGDTGNTISSLDARPSWRLPGPNKDLVRDLTPGPTPVRLACMSSQTVLPYLERKSITEAVKRIREHGYTAANYCYPMGSRNKWLDASESEIKELKDALAAYDIELFDTMVWTNLIHPDEKTRQNNLHYVAENIEAAERIGCRMVTMVTGSCDPDYYIAMHPDNWTLETWDRIISSISQLIKDTSGCRTALGIEAVVTTNQDSPQAQKRLLEDVGDPRCKICLDPTNMMSFERYYHSTELLNECFDLLGEDIFGCHAKDTFILRDTMLVYITEVPPGKGVQDYETYLVRLSRMEWPRTLLLEHFPDEEYPAAKAFIETTAERLGVRIYGK